MTKTPTAEEFIVFMRQVKWFIAGIIGIFVAPAIIGGIYFLVARDDATGGSGANFLVEWVSKEEVSEPIIEAVMIDTKGQQGISFARNGKPVREVVSDKNPRVESEGNSPSPDESGLK